MGLKPKVDYIIVIAFRKTLCNMTFQPKTAITYRSKVRLQQFNTSLLLNNESIITFSSSVSLSRYYNYYVFRQHNYHPLLISLHID